MRDIKPVRKINYSDLQNALEATEVMPSSASQQAEAPTTKAAPQEPKQTIKVTPSAPAQKPPAIAQSVPVKTVNRSSNQSGMDGFIRPAQQQAPSNTTTPVQIDSTLPPKKTKKKKKKHFDFIHNSKKSSTKEATAEQPPQPVMQQVQKPAPAPQPAQIAQEVAQIEPQPPKIQQIPKTPETTNADVEPISADDIATKVNVETQQDTNIDTDSYLHTFKEGIEEPAAEESDDPHIHSLLENLQGGDLDSIADSMLETEEIQDDQLEAQPAQTTENDEPPVAEISVDKRRSDTPSDDKARPPLAKKSDKVIAPSSETSSDEVAQTNEPTQDTKAIEGPMTNESMSKTMRSPETSAKLEAIKNDGGSPHSGNMHDSENYQLPIKPTRHHRKNDFVVWFFYTIASLSALSIAVLLVMALIS